MLRVSAGEFQKKFGEWQEKAIREPVAITRHGRESLVVLSADEYQRLRRNDRRVYAVEDLPDHIIEGIRKARVPEKYAHLDRLLDEQ